MLVYGVFLCYKLLKRKERLENVAYLAAIIPFCYLWMAGFDYLGSIFILIILWTVALFRDLIDRYGPKPKDAKKSDVDFVNSVILYAVSTGVFFLVSAIIPAINPGLVKPVGAPDPTHDYIQHWAGIFWLPILDINTNTPIAANHFFTPFRFFLMIDIMLMILPMLHEIKISHARIGAGPDIVLAILFALPSTYVVYTWIAIPLAMIPVGLILGILYFLILLTYTKGKDEKKKQSGIKKPVS